MIDENYPILELEMQPKTGIYRKSIYTLEIQLDSWDKETKEKFMNGDIFRDAEIRDCAKTVLERQGLKEAWISSGWNTEIRGSEQRAITEEVE